MAVGRNPFINKSQAWLESKLSDVNDAIVDTVTSASGGDSSSTSKTQRELERMREQLLAALRLVDPSTYSGTVPIRRTTVQFL